MINLKFDDTPPPANMTKKERDSHILWFILVQLYNLRKSTKIFGDLEDATLKKELTQINDLKTYQLILALSLS